MTTLHDELGKILYYKGVATYTTKDNAIHIDYRPAIATILSAIEERLPKKTFGNNDYGDGYNACLAAVRAVLGVKK